MKLRCVWDPGQYLKYVDERSRPFVELLARVRAVDPAYVVDLGCGPGTLTATLPDRWPTAMVEGVDSSVAMIERARTTHARSRLSFSLGDISEWTPRRPVDVLVSNAALQWLPRHVDLLPRLLDGIVPGGWFAFQVPGNFDFPSHVLLRELRNSAPWRDLIGDDLVPSASSVTPGEYVEKLAGLGCTVDAWETTYLHLLPGEDAVLEWVKGSALRPALSALADASNREAFLAEYAAALRGAYPRRTYGTPFPFRRIFVVARMSRTRPASRVTQG